MSKQQSNWNNVIDYNKIQMILSKTNKVHNAKKVT